MERDGEGLTLDAVFRTLANRTRRRVLVDLLDQRRHDEVPIEHISLQDDEGVAVREEVLYQVDLPYMDELGLISWDSDARTVGQGPQYDEIRPVVELFEDQQEDFPGGWVESVKSLT